MCETKVAAERKLTVKKHLGREKHISAMQLAIKKKSTQISLQKKTESINRQFFKKTLCEVSANMHFFTHNNANLKRFLKLRFGRPIPNESRMLELYQRMWKGVSPDTKMGFPT